VSHPKYLGGFIQELALLSDPIEKLAPRFQ
jgi:hypothetical protein